MPELYFASNRDVRHQSSTRADLFGNRFNAEGPQFFRVGKVQLSLKRGKQAEDEDNWTAGKAEIFPEKRHEETGDDRKDVLGSERLFETLRKDLKDGRRDVMIFIHGFAGTFPGTAIRAAQLRHLYGLNGSEPVTVFFSWPANGVTFPSSNYFSDREDAEMSGIAMARALRRFIEFLERLRQDDRETLLAARAAHDIARLNELQECRRRSTSSPIRWATGRSATRSRSSASSRTSASCRGSSTTSS